MSVNSGGLFGKNKQLVHLFVDVSIEIPAEASSCVSYEGYCASDSVNYMSKSRENPFMLSRVDVLVLFSYRICPQPVFPTTNPRHRW